MKFRDAYKSEIDQIVVPQTAINNINSYLEEEKQLNSGQLNKKLMHWKTNMVFACLAILCFVGFYNINDIRVFATSILKAYTIDLGWKRAELGELTPYNLDLNSFSKLSDVVIYNSDESDISYSKIYHNIVDIKNETGITMISSKLLTKSKELDAGIILDLEPKYNYGWLNGNFYYKNQHVNIDCVFALKGEHKEPIGYGNASGERYDFTYKAANGIKAYFIRSNSCNSKVFFRAGDIVYQVVSEAGVKDMKKLIDSFEY